MVEKLQIINNVAIDVGGNAVDVFVKFSLLHLLVRMSS